jgi:DNA-binding NtrC family response regulator
MNLLIIDDNPNQLYSLHIALKTKGHSVIIAGSGREALEKLRENNVRIDVVLTDYAMPGMNGLELLGHFQKEFESLPVIIMTAYGRKELVIAALQNGCAGYVEKPFTLEELMPEIERVTSLANQKALSGKSAEQIREQIGKVNDKLTVIVGGAEIAMLDLEQENLSPVKKELRDISTLAHQIGAANEIMMRAMIACNPPAGKKQNAC